MMIINILCIYKKNICTWIKHVFWLPEDKKINYYTYRLTFFGIILAMVGFGFASSEFKLAKKELSNSNVQLKKLNAKAKIDVKFKFASSTIINQGPEISEPPVDIMVKAFNNGDYNASNWEVSVMFCHKIDIVNKPNSWIYLGDNTYFLKSNNKILSQKLNEKTFFHDKLDSIGVFNMVLPGRNYIKDDLLPIALVLSYGEKTDAVSKIVIFDFKKKKFDYKDAKIEDNNFNHYGCFN